jgi:hypothetical protein
MRGIACSAGRIPFATLAIAQGVVVSVLACSSPNDGGATSNDTDTGAGGSSSSGAAGEAAQQAGTANVGPSGAGTGGSVSTTGAGGSPVTNAGGGGAGGAGGKVGAGGAGGSGGSAMQPPAGKCDKLGAVGKWEDITPPVTVLPLAAPCPYGGHFVVNPQDPTMLYRGSCNQGIWKTTDCGASWVHINTGKNGDVLDSGRQWTFAIDPMDPQILYTNSGYGAKSNGAYKSTNGGVDFEQLWPPADPAQAKIVDYNFVGGIAMDPSDRTHLLITFHAKCASPHTEACFGESKDSGATWRMVDGQAGWVGGEGQAVYFLNDSKTWLWGSQSNGLWRTSDAGATWQAVTDKMAQGHGAGQMYHSKAGVFYLPVLNGVLRSTDGVEWNIVPNSGNVMAGLVGNGTTMYASRGFPWDPSTNLYLPFWSSPESDGQHWTQMDSPKLSNGGELQYDSAHHILYSADGGAGFWRVVTE